MFYLTYFFRPSEKTFPDEKEIFNCSLYIKEKAGWHFVCRQEIFLRHVSVYFPTPLFISSQPQGHP
jgi:hypothetical protein